MAHTPEDLTITIAVAPNGDISHGVDPFTAFKDDRLRWTCKYDFWVVFTSGISPFIPNVPSQSASGGGFTDFKKLKKPKYKKEPFKYSVVVNYNGTIISKDPVIIVDDDGGGGGKAKKTKKKKAAKKK
jgi:hypothetical protein